MMALKIRLDDKLDITVDQKLELMNTLFAFLKAANDRKEIEKISTENLFNTWNQRIKKPDWINKKLSEGIGFIAEVCDLIDTYKSDAGTFIDTEYKIEYI